MLTFFKHTIFLTALFFSVSLMRAQSADSLFTAANKLYQQEKYIEALDQYQQIEKLELESASLYFNMANIYYRTNQVAPAVYYYEKALKLDPNDQDIKVNLEFANRMILDNIEPIPNSLWENFMEAVILRFTYETWSKIAVSLAFIFALLFLMYHFSYSTAKKRIYFITSILAVIFVTTSLFFAYRNKHYIDNNIEAIIFSPAAQVKNAPTTSSEVYFELHEGTKVLILETLDNWKKIKIADGKMGWIISDNLKEI
ncbi:tetratricopeptide repeat protein [Lutimonas sp.]|uniref:SH3 domain-containing protein n=1 Tax=Lutimonas sp. TaxID=1872403 RepID=UPI003D9B4659